MRPIFVIAFPVQHVVLSMTPVQRMRVVITQHSLIGDHDVVADGNAVGTVEQHIPAHENSVADLNLRGSQIADKATCNDAVGTY